LLRAINERSVLELIAQAGSASRAEVARRAGLSKPTVSQALHELERAGLVREAGRSTGRKGPSAALYELDPGSGFVLGVDVGRNWVRAALADITGRVVVRHDERARSRSSGLLVAQVGRVAREVAGGAGLAVERLTQAVVGHPGVLDPSRGALAMAPNLPGWGRQGLVEAIRGELGVPTAFENDVNLAALGEQAHGAGVGVANFVFLWVGTGVGLGLVIDGELRRGAGGAAGEIGYLPIGPGDPHDRRLRRRGLLEEWTAGAAITRAARRHGLGATTSKAVFAAARRGDAAAAAAVAEEAARIALAIAAVAPVVDPELVILGGGVGWGGGDLLLEPVARELESLSPFRPRLALAALGETAVLDGAVSVALAAARDRVFNRSREQPQRGVAG
jgi:predicted NBD/HSP70 family sugar kinase